MNRKLFQLFKKAKGEGDAFPYRKQIFQENGKQTFLENVKRKIFQKNRIRKKKCLGNCHHFRKWQFLVESSV